MDVVPREVETAVVGAGLMGSATAWALARRGRSAALFEQYPIGHRNGSSHGSARIVRRAYADPLHVRLTGRAMELWREAEERSGRALLRMTGGLDHGRSGAEEIAAVLEREDVPHELLDPAEAERRWPGMRFEGRVLFHPEAGTVDADAAVAAFTGLARAGGCSVHPETPVRRIEADGDRVRLETAAGTVRARRVVAAAGAWTSELLGGLVALPALTVTQQQVFHFPRRGLAAGAPTVVHHTADPVVYSLPGGRDGGPGDGRKIAEYRDPLSPPVTPATRTGRVDPRARDRVAGYVRRWLPGLDPEPFNEATCLYTSTADEEFVLDRSGPVVVCSPCSGHGAKFAPLIGESAADLAAGGRPLTPRFALDAPRG
ncbi:FAD-dependent oxidoreductase [Nocardiopsis composta]|uniref:Sarcosine oxidase n=1 Tax=Nocardiopsis composta TaxID=157465 RepID=A0A7W8VCD1_9ACTN|nr:FAD-dependent oxidoreductase [Nocardiopsis composta]MBB5430840.1 sarcosine oxidase [Nocardiopsis composta]